MLYRSMQPMLQQYCIGQCQNFNNITNVSSILWQVWTAQSYMRIWQWSIDLPLPTSSTRPAFLSYPTIPICCHFRWLELTLSLLLISDNNDQGDNDEDHDVANINQPAVLQLSLFNCCWLQNTRGIKVIFSGTFEPVQFFLDVADGKLIGQHWPIQPLLYSLFLTVENMAGTSSTATRSQHSGLSEGAEYVHQWWQ